MPELEGIQKVIDKENIRQTRHAIAAGGRPVSLIRIPTTSDGAGGHKPGTPVPLPVKRRYFVPVRIDGQERITVPGTDLLVQYVLIGLPDDDIRAEDYFYINAIRYDIEWVEVQTHQVKALVTRHGSQRI